MENSQKVRTLIKTIKREGTHNLLAYLETTDYFKAPASIRYHNVFEGGLITHCIGVLLLMVEFNKKYKLNIPWDTIVICSLFHDLCKVNKYKLNSDNSYTYSNFGNCDHSKLSIELLTKHIVLTPLEIEMIKYHMGIYGITEFATSIGKSNGEYSMKELINAGNNPLIKLFHWCDDMECQFSKVYK